MLNNWDKRIRGERVSRSVVNGEEQEGVIQFLVNGVTNRRNLSRDYGSEILLAQLGTAATISLGAAKQQQQALMCSQRQMVWAFNS